MADCSKTVDYLREKDRMCKMFEHCADGCLFHIAGSESMNCEMYENSEPEKAVAIMQNWSDNNPDLRKCPFCNDVAKVVRTTDDDYKAYFVTCCGCGAQGGSSEDRENAIALWNKRAEAANERRGKWAYLVSNKAETGCLCGTCSVCGVRSKYIVNPMICPNCGAKMEMQPLGGAADE